MIRVGRMERSDVEAAAGILFEAFGAVYRQRGHVPPFPTRESAAWLCRAYLDLDPEGCAVAWSGNETIGVGPQFDFQLFDRDQLYSQATRFVLSGIVNRMDRAYVAPDSCGEIRLIYRLIPTNVPQASDSLASPRHLKLQPCHTPQAERR